MKRKKLIPTVVLALTLLCGIAIGAGASSGMQEIKAYLNANITVKLDGELQSLADATGNRVYPITYNGSTYLPVRAVSNMLGINVDWDQATQTVLLGRNAGVDLIDTFTPYDKWGSQHDLSVGQVQTSDEKTEDISGVTYSHWIYFDTRFNPGTGSIAYNLQGKHNTLTFSYYAYNRDAKLRVLGDDGMVLGEYDITGGAMAKTVTIPLFSTKELRFEVDSYTAFSGVRIMDVHLDAEG